MHVETHCTKDELDRLIDRSKCARQRQRLRVIRWASDGLSAEEVARHSKLCRRQVQKWVQRFNQAGLVGLKDRPGRGRPGPLSTEQQRQLQARLAAGPTADDHVCALRGVDLQRILAQEFGIVRKLSSVYHLLHALGYSSLVPRPRHEQADPQRQEAFLKRNCPSNSRPFKPLIRPNVSKSFSKTKRDSVSKGH